MKRVDATPHWRSCSCWRSRRADFSCQTLWPRGSTAADQDTAFSLSTGDEQGPATVLRRKLTDGMQNLFYGAEEPVELDESAAAHTLAEMTQYAQDLLGALEKDSALFGGGFSVEEGATVQYASYGSGFVLWGIALSNPRGDTASFLLDDATGCVLALSYDICRRLWLPDPAERPVGLPAVRV